MTRPKNDHTHHWLDVLQAVLLILFTSILVALIALMLTQDASAGECPTYVTGNPIPPEELPVCETTTSTTTSTTTTTTTSPAVVIPPLVIVRETPTYTG